MYKEEIKSLMNILIVEDDESIAKLLRVILTRNGYPNVFVAHTGHDALKILGIEHPMADMASVDVCQQDIDLVITDIMLPYINGFEICRLTKEHVKVPVMLLTGFDIENHHARFIECGADEFLSKPVNPLELVSRIQILLDKSEREKTERVELSHSQRLKIVNLDVIADYSVTESIAWSGSSNILKANIDGNNVVVKILTQQAMDYTDVVDRFTREAEIMSRFDSPYIVKLIESGVHQELPYYIMEYIEGTNLEEYLSKNHPLKFETIWTIAESLAKALKHIHDHNIIHRDIKLKNIYLDDKIVKLGDFGIAIQEGDMRITQQGYAIGTPVYMAPEQFSEHEITHSVDIYSYGASIYHLISGSPPFIAENAVDLMRKHLDETPLQLTEYRKSIHPKWNQLIIDGCMAKRPRDRHSSMDEIIEELQELKNLEFN
ncbi:MAG: protein kinase [Lentisphaeria bacterium]|nr:protein kinase [Lentisphaeria bacterium]NQZ69750.1 protein kinase [Lentisphaeria bacterium]